MGAKLSLRREHECGGVYPPCPCSPAVQLYGSLRRPCPWVRQQNALRVPAFLTSWEAPAVFLDNLGHTQGASTCIPHGALPPQRWGSESTPEEPEE